MSKKKQIFAAIIAVLISVTLVVLVVTATTTVGNDVSVGGTLTVTDNLGVGTSTPASPLTIGSAGGFQVDSSGNITSGTWQGTPVADAYIASATNWNTAYGWGNHATAGYVSEIRMHDDEVLYFDTARTIGMVYSTTGMIGEAQNVARFVGDLTIEGDLYPHKTNLRSLGTSLYKWKDLILAGNATIDGSVGIGTTSPSSLLHVSKSSATSTITIGNSSGNSPACLKLRDSDDGGWSYCTILDGTMNCTTTSCD